MSDIDKTLRPAGSSLDISEEEMLNLSSLMTQLVSDYFSRVSSLPVFPETYGGETLGRLGRTLPIEGEPIEELVKNCRTIIELSRHNGHPRFFGYVASPSTPPGAFADLIASAVNINLTSWRSAPAATEIELTVVRWLSSLVGYSDDTHEAQGLLTSGGSMANLTALLIAHRAKSDPGSSSSGIWNSHAPMTIYASDQIHMSIPRAVDILGLGRNQLRIVESDNRFRMNVPLLREDIVRDLKDGMTPFCIVASAGTVNTGAVDPLTEIAEVAKEFGLWFHVDGAYGALGCLDETKRALFAGLNLANSVSLDPHKWLYTPVDSGCLLFRDEAQARAAFGFDDADYVKVHEQDTDESFAFWNYGPELSRRFRALKIWLTLRYYGVRRIAEAISEDNALAAYFSQCVDQAEDFERLAPVELSICCFRYVPLSLKSKLRSLGHQEGSTVRSNLTREVELELQQLNTEIMHAVQRGGRAYLSSATINDRFALRACITNFRTTRADIDHTLEIIREAAGKLK